MAYIGKGLGGQGVRTRYYYTATGGETSLSGADDNSRVLSFADGEYVDVYLNGVLLVNSEDYNTTTANTISGLAALDADDIVEIVVYDVFSVFNNTINGTFTVNGGNTTLNGDLTVDTNTLYVDSTNNNVGIGENSSLLGKLHVKTADSSGNADSGADELVLENSGDAGMTILSGTTNSGSIRFGDSDDNDNGIIIYNHGASPYMRFFVDASECMRIDSSENVGIGTSSPTGKLDVNHSGFNAGSTTSVSALKVQGSFGGGITISDTAEGGFYADTSGANLRMYVGKTASDTPLSKVVMTATSSGNVGIGTLSPAAKLDVSGSGQTRLRVTSTGTSLYPGLEIKSGSAIPFEVTQNSNGDGFIYNGANAIIGFSTNATERMRINSSGSVSIAASSGSGYLSVQQAYNGTTSSAANVHILSNGTFLRSVSSAKYKTNIEDVEMPYAEELYNLRPVYYKSLGTFDNPEYSHWGFIAEEVAEIDPRLCFFKTTEPELDDDGNIQHDDDGNIVETTLDEPVVEGVQYDRMIPLLLMLLKAEKDKVETLQTKVATLETQNADIETRLTALEAID